MQHAVKRVSTARFEDHHRGDSEFGDTITAETLRRFVATVLEVFPHSALFSANNPIPTLVGFTEVPDFEAVKALAGAKAKLVGKLHEKDGLKGFEVHSAVAAE